MSSRHRPREERRASRAEGGALLRSRRPRGAALAVCVSTAAAGALLAPPAAAQQSDLNPSLPNVLLLLDNSGSMELMLDGSDPNAASNNTNPNNGQPFIPGQCQVGLANPVNAGSAQSVANRWGTVVQVLTGSIQPYYACYEHSRSTQINGATNPFISEYQMTTGTTATSTSPPYDHDYVFSYHRPVSMTGTNQTDVTHACVFAPGNLPGAATGGVGPFPGRHNSGYRQWDYSPDGIVQRMLGQSTGASGSSNEALIQAAINATPDTSVSCFNQLTDGVLDTYGDIFRFGLMTFDADNNYYIGGTLSGNAYVSPSISSTSSPQSTVYVGGVANSIFNPFSGMWSYFQNWNTDSGQPPAYCAFGAPLNCHVSSYMENGARNPAAPPWEGRFMPFDDPAVSASPGTRSSDQTVTQNQYIQNVILATRPYGATPLAGMLADAEYYYYSDATGPWGGYPSSPRDPLVTSPSFDSSGNPVVGCRSEYIIILTDGQPNMDLRPGCGVSTPGTPGATTNEISTSGAPACPYKQPWDIAAEMLAGGPSHNQNSIKTFVVGFNVSDDTGQGLGCTQAWVTANCGTTSSPVNNACCNLQRIANYGGTGSAFFASSSADLASAMNTIAQTIGAQTTSRTVPSYSPIVSGNAGQGQANAFLASFLPNAGTKRNWSGDIVRRSWVCAQSSSSSPFTVTEPPLNTQNGDDFAANLNSSGAPAKRKYMLVRPSVSSGSVTAAMALGVLRPYVSSTVGDGLGQQTISQTGTSPTTIATDVTQPNVVGVMNIQASDSQCADTLGTSYLTPAQCADRALMYALGQPASSLNFTVGSTFNPFKDRSTNAFGDVFKATPTVVAPGAALLRDSDYTAFAATVLPNYLAVCTTLDQLTSGTPCPVSQPTFVAAPTNDGLFHYFFGDVTNGGNSTTGTGGNGPIMNEAWAIVPPGVLPYLKSYYNARTKLLDGAPVTKDVVWERNKNTVLSGSGASAWHTALVAGYGDGGNDRGFYSFDVTDPNPANFSAGGGPRFRWQLGTLYDSNGAVSAKQLFGSKSSSTPTISTVYINGPNPATDPPREVGVAILPGGLDGSPSPTATCNRYFPATGQAAYSAGDSRSNLPTSVNFIPRTQVQCWGANGLASDPVNGRSLTIARIDTGEILRVFMRAYEPVDATHFSDRPTQIPLSLVTPTPFDSPIVGRPITFPSEVGSVAQKIFVGDADGAVWRCDISSLDPTAWSCGMYLDTYNKVALATATGSTPTDAAAALLGQPISTDPVVALNPASQNVIAFASGATDIFTSTGQFFIYSTTEQVVADSQGNRKPRAVVNWYYPFPQSGGASTGERVSGPMAIFDSVLYWSTFQAANPQSNACALGTSRLYGQDYIQPQTPANNNLSNPSAGGLRRLQPSPPLSSPPDFVLATTIVGNAAAGKGVPGVSINVTPTCANLNNTVTDPLTGATRYQAQNIQQGTYSLYAQLGAQDSTTSSANATAVVNLPLPAIKTQTLIGSWAVVTE